MRRAAMIQLPVVFTALLALIACEARTATPPNTVRPVPEASAKAPAFKPGMEVVDRAGSRIGVIQSLTETPGGPNVVVEIDGKLVGVKPSSLTLRNETAVSAQTKAQIMRSAGAPM